MSRYDVPVIVVIFNNRSYNETRSRMFSRGGRQAEVGKDMLSYLGDPNVDFVRIAEAFGIRGRTGAKSRASSRSNVTGPSEQRARGGRT